jgi:hypothetical protein
MCFVLKTATLSVAPALEPVHDSVQHSQWCVRTDLNGSWNPRGVICGAVQRV